MKLLGHVYVATSCFPKNNTNLLAFGALLPETIYYTKNSTLNFDQIHEGGFDIYKFCKTNYIGYLDLALGIMTHSVKYGADGYNSLENIKIFGYTENDIQEIMTALEIDQAAAYARAHNLYDLVLDYYINKNYPYIKNIVENTQHVDRQIVSKILSECFDKPKNKIKQNIDLLWDKYDLSLFESFEKLALFWRILASDLIEKDPVNIELTARLLEKFYKRIESKADEMLNIIIVKTRDNILSAIK